MSLYGAIQMANNTLRANQIGLQVVAQNIANANTPGYSRAEVVFAAATTQRFGGVLLGLGVNVEGVRQNIDNFLEQRLRGAIGDQASLESQERAYHELEAILGTLGADDLNASLSRFFSSIQDVLNQPESTSVRNLAVLQGRNLAGDINQLSQRIAQVRTDLDQEIAAKVVDANRLIEQVRDLNVRISALEGGEVGGSDAVGLRDQRNLALSKLSKLINIRVDESERGVANVFIGGDYLIFEGQARFLGTEQSENRSITTSDIVILETRAPAAIHSGEIAGLIVARDEILGAFEDRLNEFTQAMIFEFNKVFASGQGLTGYQQITSEHRVSDTGAPLDAAGLKFSPVSGSFTVHVRNAQTGSTQQTTIQIDLDGLDGNDTSLASLREQLNAISGVTASIDPTGRLVLGTTSNDVSIAFGDDTSGVLASLGINTFFSGTSSNTIGINANVLTDPGKFAASRSGIAGDTAGAVLLAAFIDKPLESLGGINVDVMLQRMRGEVAQASAATQAVADGFRSFAATLSSQQMAVSGVSVDEETVRMLAYQHTYQAAAKFISILNELLQVLVQL